MTTALQFHSAPLSATPMRTSTPPLRSKEGDDPLRSAGAADASVATAPDGLDFAAMIAVLALAFEVQQQARSNAKQRCADFSRLVQQQSIVQKDAQISSGNKELGAAIGNLAISACMLGVGATMQWKGTQANRFAGASNGSRDIAQARPASTSLDDKVVPPKILSEIDDVTPPRSPNPDSVVDQVDAPTPSLTETARKSVSEVAKDAEIAGTRKPGDASDEQASIVDKAEDTSAQSPAVQHEVAQDSLESMKKLEEQERLRLFKLGIAGQGFTSAALVAGGVASASAQVAATQDRAQATFTKTSEDSLQATTASLNDNARVVQDGSAQTLATLSDIFRSFENTSKSIAGRI
ncbi:MAG TPA: hypothetical protein VL424_05910 [Pararobbsia sp.]|nr:hypothetical protein [Pararobbsia sp.]